MVHDISGSEFKSLVSGNMLGQFVPLRHRMFALSSWNLSKLLLIAE